MKIQKPESTLRMIARLRAFSLPVLGSALALLGACATAPAPSPLPSPPPEATAVCPPPTPCPVCPVCPAPPPAPAKVNVLEAVTFETLPGWREDDLTQALAALRASCRALRFQPPWRAACEGLENFAPGGNEQLRSYFESAFVPYRIANPDGTTQGLVTGYYEPLLHGSRNRAPPYLHPLYTPPEDLLTIDLTAINPALKNMRLRGRLEGRRVVPYYSRAEIENGRAPVAGREILWVDDPVEAFFLQIQGSGRVRLESGELLRIGYADQNGHPYRSIGRWLLDQGELPPGEATMPGIKAWARANPERLAELLNRNPSYVFFREMGDGDATAGPIGALGVPLTPGRSIAVDARFVPLGAPVFLETTWPNSDAPLERLVLAQDTGGAIRGAVRADFFWGFGAEAGNQAGKMRQNARMWVLLPRGLDPPQR
ncbi:MAG: MltA domain-containing protein [Betaproteobacteria bacterium]|nr:MltA domain-containing protein [Betaproteobacteria bacterium]